MFTFSIFTPTYNRKHTLHRAYNTLCNQTYKDFEWIIIDDGSIDGTEDLVSLWIQENKFKISYYYQTNQGKHIAYNHYSKYANGKYFISIDSDDAAKDNWLERNLFHLNQLEIEGKNNFWGIYCLAEDQNGNLIGNKFKKDILDGNWVEIMLDNMQGDKGYSIKMDVFKEFPFPEDVKNVYLPESYFFHAMSSKYNVRCVNERLIVPWVDEREDHLSNELLKRRNLKGLSYGCLGFLKYSMRYFFKFPKEYIIKSIYYVNISFLIKKKFTSQIKEIESFWGIVLWFFSIPAGYILSVFKQKKYD